MTEQGTSPRTQIYRGTTRQEAERAYHEDARNAADSGFVPSSEDWSVALGQHTLTVGYVYAPEQVSAVLAALAEPLTRADLAPSAPPPIAAAPVANPPTRGSRRGPILIGLAVIVAVVAIGAYGLRQRVDQIVGDVNSVTGTSTPATTKVSTSCAATMQPLTDSLTSLDSRLSIGMNFSAYSDKVGEAKTAYDRLDLSKLDTSCIAGVGQDEENALNAYIRAYNTWNDCVGKSGCTNDSIKSQLQSEWSKATEALASVKRHLP